MQQLRPSKGKNFVTQIIIKHVLDENKSFIVCTTSSYTTLNKVKHVNDVRALCYVLQKSDDAQEYCLIEVQMCYNRGRNILRQAKK